MIRLLLALLLLLFHAGAMAGGGNPPSISLAGILSAYTEGDGTKTPASDVTITAGDSGSPNFTATEIQSASVFINVGYQSSEDVLAFPNANGITGSWNSSTAVLSLTASSPLPSIATWEQALESVTYQNTSDDPSTNLRSFQYRVTDSLAGQNNTLASFSVVAVNDAPVITDASSTLAYTEEDPAAMIDATLTISDAENDQLQSATVTISSGYEPSEDALNFDSASASPLGITGSFVSGTLTLSGGSSAANYETILESVTYQNSNAINPSETNRTITWTVSDGSDNSVAATSTITVTAVDDPSIFSGDISGTGEEDASISGTLTVTDPEGITSPNFAIDSQASSGNASIVSSSGLWQYTPDINYSGTDSFTVKATDDLGNNATQSIS